MAESAENEIPAAARPPWALGFLLAALVLAVFSRALANGYVWDDHIYFSAYPADVYFASWWESGREPFAISDNYFRPLAMLSFLADFAAGPDAAASHLINLLLHALNAALVGFLAWRLPGARGVAPWIAMAAGLWYGLHPALVEPAATVMCRFDLLAATFSLLLLHASLTTAPWTFPAMSLLFLAALLSKESAAGLLVAWPFWCAAVAWLRGNAKVPVIVGPLLKGWAALGMGLLLDLAGRYWARGFVWVFGDSAPSGSGHLELMAMSVAEQVRLMVLPFGAVDPLHTLESFRPASYGVALAALAATGFLATRPAARPWAALALAGFAALAPTSNLIPIPFAGDVYTADRYLTLPLVFLAPTVAAALRVAWERSQPARWIALALLAVWLLASAALARATLPLLEDDARFWAWVLRLHPAQFVAQNNLASALIDEERFSEAIRVLGQAAEANRGDPSLWLNLARARGGLGQLPQALVAIDRAIAIDPADEHLWNVKATLLARAGDFANAERIIRERVLVANPGLVGAHLNLIQLLVVTGRSAEAEAYIDSRRDVLVGAWRERALALIPARK